MSEHLTVNGVALNDTDTYWIEDLSPLRGTAERVGAVHRMPYTSGGIIYTHRDAVTELVFPLLIAGEDWATQETNEQTIWDSVVGADEVLTVPAVWTRHSGALWTADVLVRGLFEPRLESDRPPIMRYNLVLLVKGGRFAPPVGP